MTNVECQKSKEIPSPKSEGLLARIFHNSFEFLAGRGFWEQNPTEARHFGDRVAEPDAKTRLVEKKARF